MTQGKGLQKLIDVVVCRYCNRWRLKIVGKSAFSRDNVEGRWKWGNHELPKCSRY